MTEHERRVEAIFQELLEEEEQRAKGLVKLTINKYGVTVTGWCNPEEVAAIREQNQKAQEAGDTGYRMPVPDRLSTHLRTGRDRNGNEIDQWDRIWLAGDREPDHRQPTNNRTARTIGKMQRESWKSADRKTSYKTGIGPTDPDAPKKAKKGRPAGQEDRPQKEHRCPSCNGIQLRRFYVDGHEECSECHWKGDPKPARTRGKDINLGHADWRDRQPVRKRRSIGGIQIVKATGPLIDRKRLLAEYLERRAKEGGKDGLV